MDKITQSDFLFSGSVKLLLESGIIDDYLLAEILHACRFIENCCFRKINDKYFRYKSEMYSGIFVNYFQKTYQAMLDVDVNIVFKCKRCKHKFYAGSLEQGKLSCPCCRCDKLSKVVS